MCANIELLDKVIPSTMNFRDKTWHRYHEWKIGRATAADSCPTVYALPRRRWPASLLVSSGAETADSADVVGGQADDISKATPVFDAPFEVVLLALLRVYGAQDSVFYLLCDTISHCPTAVKVR
ncbi:hypothetical protein ACJJTC_007128 [Scirpophaga incertulas]